MLDMYHAYGFNKNGLEKKTCLYEPIKQWHINIQPFLYGDFITNKGNISIAGFDKKKIININPLKGL